MPTTTPTPLSLHPVAAQLPTRLRVQVDPAGRVVVDGELDRATCHHVATAGRVLAAAAAPVWVVDLTGLTFCDATGLRALAAFRRTAEAAGAVPVLVGARPFHRRLLAVAGLGDVLAPG